MKDLAVPLAEPGWWLCVDVSDPWRGIARQLAQISQTFSRAFGAKDEEWSLPNDVSTYLFVYAQTWFRARGVARVKLGTDQVLCVLNTKPTMYPRTPKGLFDAHTLRPFVVRHYVGNPKHRTTKGKTEERLNDSRRIGGTGAGLRVWGDGPESG